MSNGRGARLKNNEKKACPRKRRYAEAQVAREAAEWSTFEFGTEYVPYFCRWCQGYHIGRASTTVNALRRKMVRRAMGGAS